MKSRVVFGLLLVAACAPAAPVPDHGAVPAPAFEAWVAFGGDEVGPMCLLLFDNGALEFRAGFEFLNPGTWSFDSATAQLRLTLPSYPFDADHVRVLESIRAQATQSRLQAFDSRTKTLTYDLRMNPDSLRIDFDGWYFFAPSYFEATGEEPWIDCGRLVRRRQ